MKDKKQELIDTYQNSVLHFYPDAKLGTTTLTGNPVYTVRVPREAAREILKFIVAGVILFFSTSSVGLLADFITVCVYIFIVVQVIDYLLNPKLSKTLSKLELVNLKVRY